MSNGNDLLMGSGTPSAKFPVRGTRVGGAIVSAPIQRQQTDMKTQEPKFFRNGDPMMQVVVRVKTDERDPMLQNDDGVRALYIKGKTIKAVRQACLAAGATDGLEVGGHLSLTWTGSEPATGGLPEGAKIYEVDYRRPDVLAQAEAATPQATYQAPPQAPPGVATTQLTQTFADNLSEEQKAALRNLGVQV